MEVFLLHHARLAKGELALVTPRLDVEILPLVLLLKLLLLLRLLPPLVLPLLEACQEFST